MKVKGFIGEQTNTGLIAKITELIDIRDGRWVDKGKVSHLMNYKRIRSFKDKRVYFLYRFGNGKSGIHVSLSFLQNQRFLYLQKAHWLQKADNLKWVISGHLIGSAGISLNYYMLFISK